MSESGGGKGLPRRRERAAGQLGRVAGLEARQVRASHWHSRLRRLQRPGWTCGAPAACRTRARLRRFSRPAAALPPPPRPASGPGTSASPQSTVVLAALTASLSSGFYSNAGLSVGPFLTTATSRARLLPLPRLLVPSFPLPAFLVLKPLHVCERTRFSRVQLCETLRTAAHQVSLSMGFSRQEYWLPCPPPGNLPDPGIEPN